MLAKMLMTGALTLGLWMSSVAHAGDWEEIYTQDGVKVSSKEIEGSPLIAFRGETVMDVPVNRVLFVLMDNPHRTEWVDRLYECRVLEQIDPYTYVIYQAFELPAIFANRDYVYKGKVTEDDKGVVTLAMASVEHPAAPPTVGVRANLINSRYVLTPIEGGAKTNVVVEIQTDPAGMMPTWLVNLIQKSWPLETLNGIKGQFAKYEGVYKTPHEAAAEAAAAAAPPEAPAPAPEPAPVPAQ